MIMLPMHERCDQSPTGSHAALRENGKVKQVNGSPLKSICRHCGRMIARAHQRSTHWQSTPEE